MVFFRFATFLEMGIGIFSVAYAAAQVPAADVHKNGRIRVFYHTSGPHAVEATDTNENGIPDVVEDTLTQTLAAQLLWVKVLGFQDPLDSVRYKKAAFVDIHLRHKDALKANGKAFDEMQPTRVKGDPPGTLRISFHLATSVRPKTNLTPTHEYFHLIQYASTYFKNRWFTEGTARWSERGLGAGALGPTQTIAAWPMTPEGRKKLHQQAYDAAECFWNPLAKTVNPDDAIPDSEASRQLQAMTYTDGTSVLKDLKLTGWQFIRDVLREMGRQDKIAFRELNYESWSEQNQKSSHNNRYLMQAVETVIDNTRKSD